jgi:hypothetical protein
VVASKETGLAVNGENTKCRFVSPKQHAGKNQNINLGNKSFKRERHFIYLETTLTNQNSTHEKNKRRLKLGTPCYHSLQNPLSSSLLSKNIKIKIYRTVILPVVLYGCETWSRTVREERRLRAFEIRVLGEILSPKRDE